MKMRTFQHLQHFAKDGAKRETILITNDTAAVENPRKNHHAIPLQLGCSGMAYLPVSGV